MLFVEVEKLATWRSRSRAAAMTPAPGSEHVMRLRLAIVSIAASGLLSAGCLVGPNYSKPELPTPEAIRGAEASGRWSRIRRGQVVGGVPGRTAPDARAHRGGPERQRAAGRGACAWKREAQLGITRSDQYPSVSADVQAGGGRTPAQGSTAARNAAALRLEGSTAWELDFWGRFRRATESARAQLLATRMGAARGADDRGQPGCRQRTSSFARWTFSSISRAGR